MMVAATQRFFIFTRMPGEMIQFDYNIFQMGWNHQLVDDGVVGCWSFGG